MKRIALVNTLAAQIRSLNNSSRSESMRQAWAIIKTTPDAKLLVFFKLKSGETCRRVVSENWTRYQAPKGGTSTNKPGQMLFADLGKVCAGMPCIISTYQSQIQKFA